MSSTFDRATPHPVLACADTMGTALKESADAQLAFMEPADKRTALIQLTRLEARLVALRLRCHGRLRRRGPRRGCS